MKLFAFYLGGKTETSHCEVHDMRFALGNLIEDCFPSLRSQWWGKKRVVHIDAYAVLDHVDGYDLEVKNEPYLGTEKLFFLNLGGYDPTDFSELHKNVFVVAEDDEGAKQKALQEVAHWQSPHKDKLIEVEAVVSLHDITKVEGMHLHLKKAVVAHPLAFHVGFISLAEHRNTP